MSAEKSTGAVVFRKKIYDVVKRIPRGKVLSYKQVAKLAGYPKAYRAVGNVLNKNTDPEVPCHRVIKSDGKTGNYRRGPKKKASLLKKEGVLIINRKVAT